MMVTHSHFLAHIDFISKKHSVIDRTVHLSFIANTLMELKRYHRGNTMAIQEYFNLFEFYMKGILWIVFYRTSEDRDWFFDRLQKEILPYLFILEYNIAITKESLSKMHADHHNTKRKHSRRNVELTEFIDGFHRRFFKSSASYLDLEEENQILSITRLFFTKYISLRKNSNLYMEWHNHINIIFNLSQSLKDFLLADSILTAEIIHLNAQFKSIASNFLYPSFSIIMSRLVNYPTLPKLRGKQYRKDIDGTIP